MRREFVGGGSKGARLTPYGGDEMRGKSLTDKERQGIYTMQCLGESKEAIADRYEVSVSTVYRVIKEEREKREKGNGMSSSSKVVAGDKANGRLMSCADRNRYEGTCIVNGKSKKRTFTAVNARDATEQWEKWCQTLRDEQEFLDRIERKSIAEQPKAVCGYPSDPVEEIHSSAEVEKEDGTDVASIEPAPVPDIKVRPWREVAEERQTEIDELRKRVEYLEGRLEGKVTADGHSYLLWSLVGGRPKFYGLYLSEDSALSEGERINEVAAFLGNSGAFEVEEVAWRS